MYDFQEYAYAGNMLYPDSTECQRLETSPYATVNLYSKKSDKPTENAYLDRMKQWNPTAFRKAEEKVFGVVIYHESWAKQWKKLMNFYQSTTDIHAN